MSSSLPADPFTVGADSTVQRSRHNTRTLNSTSPIRTLSLFQGAHFWFIPVILACGLALYIFALLSTSGVHRQEASEAGQITCLLLLMITSLTVSFRTGPGQARWAWRFIGIAFAFYSAAEMVYGYLSIVTQHNPTPSLADPLYLSFYPLMAIGLILLPQIPLNRAERLRAIINGAVIAGALLGISLLYLIGPTYLAGATTPLELYVYVAYPVGDFILIAALSVLAVRGIQTSYRPIFLLLTAGMLCFIYADSAYDIASLQNTYFPGALNIDPLWVLGELLMIMAPIYLLVHGDPTSVPRPWLSRFSVRGIPILPGNILRLLVPYLAVAILFALLWINQPAIPATSFFLALEVLAFLVIVLIITSQLLIARDLQASQEATARAQQLDSLKDQFITSVNHELRTPIMTMQGYIELLGELQNTVGPEERTSMVTRARQANEALVHLVQGILDTRRIDQGAQDFEPQPILLHSSLFAALAVSNPNTEHELQRDLFVEVPETITVWGDPVRLQEVFVNLVTNAIKYSAQGTPLRISAHTTQPSVSPSPIWRRQGRRRQPMVELTFRDQGFGIPPDEIPLLFRRFVRLPRDLGSKILGTGLGLYLCRIYIEAMGGTIWVESTGVPGEGSTFHILLRAAPRVVSTTADAPAPTTPELSAQGA